MRRRDRAYDDADWACADDALSALDPEAPDAEIARVVANYLTSGWGPPYYLFIFHDERPSAIRHVEKMAKQFPGYWNQFRVGDGYSVGMCRLRFNREFAHHEEYWQRKNMVGIKTPYREAAEHWAREAMLLGYAVFSTNKIGGSGGSQGTIEEIRERKRERRKDQQRTHARLVETMEARYGAK